MTRARGLESETAQVAWTTRFKTRLKARLTAGLILIVPIWITLLLVGFIFRLTRDASLWALHGLLLSPWGTRLLQRWGIVEEGVVEGGLETLPLTVQWVVAALAVLMTLAMIYVLGGIASNMAGRRVIRLAEAVVDRLPFVKTVYHSSKQVLETFAAPSAGGFQRVVLVPFPSREAYSIGFVTRVIGTADSPDQTLAVFVATTPNPTTGFVLLIKRADAIELDWTIEEAVRVIMSGGVLLNDTMYRHMRRSAEVPPAPTAEDPLRA